MKPELDSLVIYEELPLSTALERLNNVTTGTLFVIDNRDRISGVLTDGDIRNALLRKVRLEDKVAVAMNRGFVAARRGEVSEDFLRNLDDKISYLPIVNDQGRIVDYYSFVVRSKIPVAQPMLDGAESRYVNECMASNWISSQGRFVREFEENFARFCGVKYAAATSSGTTALHLALECLGISPDDEVIVPSLTFVATANAVTYTGATPIFVDSEMGSWNIDPLKLEAAISERTRAVIPVHLFGQPARMDEIMSIARKHNLYVIEDVAEAHGARYKGQVAGSLGEMACFSFFGNKILTTGEGGMLVTDDEQLIEKARILRDHGMSPTKRYWHPFIGFNYRMTNLQAAIGCAQLEKIDNILASKLQIYEWYNSRLVGEDKLILPPHNDWSQSVYWMYSVLIDLDKVGLTRDEVLEILEEKGIEGRPFFIPIHTMPPYNTGQSLDTAQYLSSTGLCLPSYVGLTEDEVDFICDCLLKILHSGRAA